VVRQKPLQKYVKLLSMIRMMEMAEFVQENVVLKNLRKSYYIEIQIDISSGRAASPVG